MTQTLVAQDIRPLNMIPASCGYLPKDGWPNEYARDGHRDTCDKCGDIEAQENYERERRRKIEEKPEPTALQKFDGRAASLASLNKQLAVIPPAQVLADDPYVGVAALPFDERAQLALAKYQTVPDEWIDIRPEGLIYLSHMKLRAVFNEAFGYGGWGLVPVGDYKLEDDGGNHVTVYREYRLYVAGRFVAEAIGAGDYWKNNPGQNYGDACESAQSYALNRLGKPFGIASQCWDKAYAENWKRQRAEQYTNSRTGKLEWRKKSGMGADAGKQAAQPVVIANSQENPDISLDGSERPQSATQPAASESAESAPRNPVSTVRLTEAGREWYHDGTKFQMFKDSNKGSWKAQGAQTIATCEAACANSKDVRVEFTTESWKGRTQKVIVSAEPVL